MEHRKLFPSLVVVIRNIKVVSILTKKSLFLVCYMSYEPGLITIYGDMIMVVVIKEYLYAGGQINLSLKD